ncbi:hypothetical protein GTR05_004563 [Salmonella enterica]|nr:hypothetical protein [Salmonella enterica]
MKYPNIMQIRPIRTEQDYEAALRAVEPLFDNEPALYIGAMGLAGDV